MSLRIEVATDIAACALTVPIQAEVWNGDVVVPPQLLLAAVRSGGYVALGHIDGDERPAGFVFGFAGVHGGGLRHHSHMLAVRGPHRGSGLAAGLKAAQREHCLGQKIGIMTWTMDPLEARNAHFNFAKLGAHSRTYLRDHYGAMPDRLNAGLPSDRFEVEWALDEDRTERRLRGADRIASLEETERGGVGYLLRAERGRPAGLREPGGERQVLLEIPPDFQAVKRTDAALALAWRHAARAAFEAAFADGYTAMDFLRSSDGRGAYLLGLAGTKL